MATQLTVIRPDFTKMFGVLHDPQTSEPFDRVPRTLKVGIGELAGKDIHVAIRARDGKWIVRVGKNNFECDTMEQARTTYRKEKPNAPDRSYPTKLPYFTFSKVAPDGGLEPDFECISRHGGTPTELDIVFADDQPLQTAFEMWHSSGLQCKGDGLNALRSLDLDPTKQAISFDGRTFPIINGCAACGCPYRKETMKGTKVYPAACKPHARLAFQLVNDIRLGGKAEFNTTSFRSINNLYSCIMALKRFTGGGDPNCGFIAGIPLRMLLRPFKTSHKGPDGKLTSGKAYCVSLEFRSQGLEGIRKKILAYGAEFRSVMTGELPEAKPVKQIEAPEEEPELTEVEQAAIFAAEFQDAPDEEVGDEEPTQETGSVEAAAAVAEKKLESMRRDAGSTETAAEHDVRLESQMAEQLEQAKQSGEDPGFFGEPAPAPAPPAKTGFRMGRKL